MKRNRRVIWLLGGIGLARTVAAQTSQAPFAPPASEKPALEFSLTEYVKRVLETNPDLEAEHGSLRVAQAQIEIARVVPDPTLTLGSPQYDTSGSPIQNEASASLAGTLELGGKRAARVGLAQANAQAAAGDYADAIRLLRAAAANAYVDAVRARLILERKRKTLESLDRLVAANRARLAAGDIPEIVLVQSRVEAQRFQGEVASAEADVRTTDLTLLQLLGLGPPPSGPARVSLTSDLHLAPKELDPAVLIASATTQRPDLRAAESRLTAAQQNERLTRSNRVIDLSPSISWTHVYPENTPVSVPGGNFLGFGLGFPIPFSRVHKGDLAAASAGKEQADAGLHSMRVRVETDVRQALARQEAASRQVSIYETGTLADADRVFDKTLYSFQRGAATIVEVLIAQQTVDDVYISYYDALADQARSVIALREAVGSDDLE